MVVVSVSRDSEAPEDFRKKLCSYRSPVDFALMA